MTDFSNIRYEALDSHDCCENQPVASAFVQHETVEWSPSRIHVKAESGAFPAAESSKSSFGGARRGISYNKSGVPRETRARWSSLLILLSRCCDAACFAYSSICILCSNLYMMGKLALDFRMFHHMTFGRLLL